MTEMFLRLTKDEVAALDMLYVARFAVDPREPAPALDPADGVFPYYNHELAKVFLALGIKVTPCRDLSRLAATVPAHNYVFTIYNRAPMRNCELFVSTICESAGMPYLGAPPNVRALAEDKYWTKLMAKGLGLPVPEGTVYRHEHDLSRAPAFDGPYFIKPRFGAASEEIAVDSAQDSWAEAQLKAAEMLSRGKEVLVEQCISGTDLTVPVLGGWPPKILAVAEEVSDLPNGIATYRQKRLLDKGRQRSICEDQAVVETVTGHARRFVEQVQPFDYLRVDFRLDGRTRLPYLLEFNVGCNLGSHAAVALAGRHNGLSHEALISHIIATSLRRQNWAAKVKRPALAIA